MLSELKLRTSYHKGRDNVAQEFYLPCMDRAAQYDRAVGFFRSTVFAVAWPALRGFVARGAKMRLLCSHVLSDADIEALEQGYAARLDDALADHFREEVVSLVGDPLLRQPARILAALVASGAIELKIAVLRGVDRASARGRIFHDKLGVFRDAFGNSVIFKGSMNETWTGLASDGNLESIDVAGTWMGERDRERVLEETRYFDDLWADKYPGLSVRPFPEVARAEFERVAAADWASDLDEALRAQARPASGDARGRTLHPHQAAGLAAWSANGRRGILAFATGSGKTFTAITAMREALTERGEVVVLIVPDQVLFAQWYKEIVETTADIGAQVLRAGSGYGRWRQALSAWTAGGEGARIVLATIQTASSSDFLSGLPSSARILLVIDEVHRAGSPKHQRVLDEGKFLGPRLGLSATPERAGDPAGTSVVVGFFRGVLEPRYSLADAVRDGVLCPYFYRPHPVALEDQEKAQWDVVTAQIGKLQARIRSGDSTPHLADRVKKLLIDRARIVKQAAAKVPLAVAVIKASYRDGQHWLVYCDDLSQLGAVCAALENEGYRPLPFHSQMRGDRGETLAWFAARGGLVVAIKCLDEGVDVPAASHALILASSRNPREFVQRRGRVLRRSPGKGLAYIHDAIVIPPPGGTGPDPITAGELGRATEFAGSAANPSCATDLERIAIDTGIDWQAAVNLGVEIDDEDE